MLIEEIMPQVVQETSLARHEFFAACLRAGLDPGRSQALLERAPQRLLDCECFLDRVTVTWRYEFGEPHLIDGQFVWGIHTWPLLDRFCLVLDAAERLLNPAQRRECWVRLQDPTKHNDVLTEFLPILRATAAVPSRYEVPTRIGNHTADWEFAIQGRMVLLDVKYRIYDSLELLARIERGERDPDGTAPAPTHDHTRLFQSVEKKFPETESADVFQGVWIASEVTQEREDFTAAFQRLNPRRVHFAVLGSWESSPLVVAQSEDDRVLLETAFGGVDGTSPVFERG